MAGRFIDKLVKAARLDPVKREVKLSDGTEVVMWIAPMTAAERDRAKKDARSDDPNAFALQLLIQKAKDGNGMKLFTPADAATLRNKVRDEDLQKLMMAVLTDETEEGEEEFDMKSDSE